jgi:hypothetical protein
MMVLFDADIESKLTLGTCVFVFAVRRLMLPSLDSAQTTTLISTRMYAAQ